MEQKKEQPTNKFREELAKREEKQKELLENDIRATYLYYKTLKQLKDRDVAHIQAAIDKWNDFGQEIFKMAKTPATEVLLAENKVRIDNLTKQRDSCAMTLKDFLVFTSLEQRFEGANNGKEKNRTADKNVPAQ